MDKYLYKVVQTFMFFGTVSNKLLLKLNDKDERTLKRNSVAKINN